jgi:GT2 family glycosyltransferase
MTALSSTPVAIAVPNLNQGRFLDAALDSLRQSGVDVAIALVDAGSTDDSRAIIERRQRAGELIYARSHADTGQTAAINEGVAEATRRAADVRYVGWLNADDLILPGAFATLVRALEAHPEWSAVAGRAHCVSESGGVIDEIATSPFSIDSFSHACTICQPATLIRREAWEAIGGLDASLQMCFDYDLWWRLARIGTIGYVPELIAASRDHAATKTRQRREEYFREAIALVRRETGGVPWHWCISEALEHQSGWTLGRRPAGARKLLAGVEAVVAYLGRNWLSAAASRPASKVSARLVG